MSRILFMCTGNTGRSQVAQAFARIEAPAEVELLSAGDEHHIIHPMVHQVAREFELELPEKVPHTLSEIAFQSFDIVVTLCNQARESCPTLPGSPARIHWGLIDPTAAKGDPKENIRSLCQEIRERVQALFHQGFFQSILQIRNSFGALLDNLTDGVMAHDLSRRIFYFNKAAQKITGFDYSEVIGRDCHQVFAGRFCGGNCSFCDAADNLRTKLRYPVTITRHDSEKRDVEMSVVPIRTERDEVEGAMVIFRDASEMLHPRQGVDGEEGFQGIVGRDPKMKKVFDAIRELADVDVPVLIQGESGTGKEMVANALHNLSHRSGKMFVPINCGALPEGILESELFGHVRGAFTGAIRDKKGRFELADQGTLFLDEIGEISQSMQVKLLRVLQEKSFVPVGGEKTTHVNVRVISASNKDLRTMTETGLFREDLYYRLAVIPIELPPLRERVSDIPLLVDHFINVMSAETNRTGTRLSSESMDLITAYPWPGNIRQLRNAIQYGLIKCKGELIEIEHLPPEIVQSVHSSTNPRPGRPAKLTPERVSEALIRAGNNKAKAARLLSVSRTTLYRYLSEIKV